MVREEQQKRMKYSNKGSQRESGGGKKKGKIDPRAPEKTRTKKSWKSWTEGLSREGFGTSRTLP